MRNVSRIVNYFKTYVSARSRNTPSAMSSSLVMLVTCPVWVKGSSSLSVFLFFSYILNAISNDNSLEYSFFSYSWLSNKHAVSYNVSVYTRFVELFNRLKLDHKCGKTVYKPAATILRHATLIHVRTLRSIRLIYYGINTSEAFINPIIIFIASLYPLQN